LPFQIEKQSEMLVAKRPLLRAVEHPASFVKLVQQSKLLLLSSLLRWSLYLSKELFGNKIVVEADVSAATHEVLSAIL